MSKCIWDASDAERSECNWWDWSRRKDFVNGQKTKCQKKTLLANSVVCEELQERTELREIFMNDIPPSQLSYYCTLIGFPVPLLRKIICKTSGDTVTVLKTVLSEVFDRWYAEATQGDPRFILARACYERQNIAAFHRLMEKLSFQEFFQTSSETFEKFARTILLALSE